MKDPRFGEIWVSTSDGQSMCALINGDAGWLMYLREEGDAGFSSRNPGYSGPADAMIGYELSNGQLDEYPASWSLPVGLIQQALAYFREQGRPPPFILWHNDAEDGVVLEHQA